MKYVIVILSLACCSCNWAKEKTKVAVNKTGEVVGKTGSEFAQGLTKGVEKTFTNDVIFSDQLIKSGIRTGRMIIHGTDSTTDNVLTAYLIFNDDFDRSITIRVISETGQEYGRVSQQIQGKKGEAKYVDFVFDKRTNIDSKGKLMFE